MIALSLTACMEGSAPTSALKPRLRPERAAPEPPVVIRPTSEKSAALRAYLTEVQSAQLTQGLLRRDGGGPDTPFTTEMVTRNFVEIAFFNEYGGPGLTASGTGLLRRWADPVRIGLEFGPSVPPSRRRSDTRDVSNYAARLSRITGHPISVGAAPNFVVAFLSEDDRAEALPRIAARLPGLTPRDLAPLADLPDDIYCLVVAYPDTENPAQYAAALAIIRAENPDLLRLSCIHEELAQGLGLANDSPDARPSIFNDDDEFALLTRHDELLLQMLYDPRLAPGMTPDDATPLLRQIAGEVLESGS